MPFRDYPPLPSAILASGTPYAQPTQSVPESVTLDDAVLDATTASALAGRTTDGQGEQVFDVYRVALDGGPSGTGAHRLTASVPVGIQVVGYGRFTSYQYPGGLNLNLISEPPIPIIR